MFKTILAAILSLSIATTSFGSEVKSSPVVIKSSTHAKALKQNLSLNDVVDIDSGNTDPSAVAVNASKGSLYIYTGGLLPKLFQKQDAGLTTNWTEVGGGGGAITSLTNDVSASGPGAASATVNFVGGSSAADIHTAELLANAATPNYASFEIVKRDGSGGFKAGIVKLLSDQIQLGSADPFSRNQIWNYMTSSILRLGSWESDGDPTSVASEGIVVYDGSLTGQPISMSNGGYARIKPLRFGLFTVDSTLPFYAGGDYWYRVDDTSIFYRNNAGTKVFDLDRSTGNTSILGDVSVHGSSAAGALNIKSKGTALTDGINLTNSSGSKTWSLNSNGVNTLFLYDGAGNINLSFSGSFGGSGPSAPAYKWDVNGSDANTSVTSIGTQVTSAVTNIANTNGNFSTLAFVNSAGGVTSAVEGVHDNHNSDGSATGHVNVLVNTAGTKKVIGKFDGNGFTDYGALSVVNYSSFEGFAVNGTTGEANPKAGITTDYTLGAYTTGDTSSGSPTITNVASTSGLVAGMVITGTGIPANTFVNSFTANSITMSSNASATNTGVTLSFAASFFAKAKDSTGTDAAGGLIARSGGSANGQSGPVVVRSGDASGSGNTGSVIIRSGNSTSGNSGNVSIQSGTAGGTRGSVTLNGSSVTLNGNGSGTISANNLKINNVVDPTSAQDAATKNYVDTHSGGVAVRSAHIDSTGTVSREYGGDWLNGNCSHPSTGQYDCTINAGICNVTPNVLVSQDNTADATGKTALVTAESTTSFSVRTYLDNSGLVDRPTNVMVQCE